MANKEALKKLKELLIEKKQLSSNQNTDGKRNLRMQKSLGTHPKGGKVSINTIDDKDLENENHQKGYSSIWMLCFLTFFFEVLFLFISYLIFR